ncbi:MAG: hypothetical protein U0931_03775 [Vulcanimicrobiota bacterium]
MLTFVECLVLYPFLCVVMTAWWNHCALHSEGPNTRIPGGPSKRLVAYHSELQQRIGEGSRLD